MGQPAARVTDMHVCPMVTPGTPPVPHVGGPILPACSPNVITGFLPQARVTDLCLCVGPTDSIVKGSPTVLVNNLMAARIGDLCAHGGTIVTGFPTVLIGDAGSGGSPTGAPLVLNFASMAAALCSLSPAEAREALLEMPYQDRVGVLNAMVDNPTLLDVSTAPDCAVFYSGQVTLESEEKVKARTVAEGQLSDDKTILEQTPGGKFLDALQVYQGILRSDDADKIWTKLSGRYAESASGEVVVYMGEMRPNAVLHHELEVLRGKQAEGSVTSLKIYRLDEMLGS